MVGLGISSSIPRRWCLFVCLNAGTYVAKGRWVA
jgi:hypothetical protein